MEVIDWPLELDSGDGLPAADITDWLDFNYPMRVLSELGNPAVLIAKQMGMEEELLCKVVHKCFCALENEQLTDQWLVKRKHLRAEYALDLVLRGSVTDELFILLVAQATDASISIAHMGGLWTTKKHAVANIDDNVFLVFPSAGFWHLLPVTPQSSPVVSFHPPDTEWTAVILILRGLISDIQTTSYMPKCDPLVPLLKILSNLANHTQQQYRQEMIKWMVDFPDLNIITDWLSQQQCTWDDYKKHLV